MAGNTARLAPVSRDKWSVRDEYLYVQMAEETTLCDTAENQEVKFSSKSHLLRLGSNYHFDGFLN